MCNVCQEKGVLGVFAVRGAHSEKFHLGTLKPKAALLFPVEVNATITPFQYLQFPPRAACLRSQYVQIRAAARVCDLVIALSEIKLGFMKNKQVSRCLSNSAATWTFTIANRPYHQLAFNHFTVIKWHLERADSNTFNISVSIWSGFQIAKSDLRWSICTFFPPSLDPKTDKQSGQNVVLSFTFVWTRMSVKSY